VSTTLGKGVEYVTDVTYGLAKYLQYENDVNATNNNVENKNENDTPIISESEENNQ